MLSMECKAYQPNHCRYKKKHKTQKKLFLIKQNVKNDLVTKASEFFSDFVLANIITNLQVRNMMHVVFTLTAKISLNLTTIAEINIYNFFW